MPFWDWQKFIYYLIIVRITSLGKSFLDILQLHESGRYPIKFVLKKHENKHLLSNYNEIDVNVLFLVIVDNTVI